MSATRVQTSAQPTNWRRDGTTIKNTVGDVVADLRNVSKPDQAEANADFIVLACNAHGTLVDELAKADTIIRAMLNTMTPAQKAKVSEKLEAAGVAPDGMTRHHERQTTLAKAGFA